jgi:hypothetical protein
MRLAEMEVATEASSRHELQVSETLKLFLLIDWACVVTCLHGRSRIVGVRFPPGLSDVQTGSGAHPNSYTIYTREGFFLCGL